MENLETMLAAVRSALASLNGQSISGSQIHRLIAEAAPELDIRAVVGIPVGPGALTNFIERHLQPTVKRIGNRGGDTLYGIGDDVMAPSSVTDSSIWKAFVSPNGPNILSLRISDLKLMVVRNAETGNDQHVISRVTDAEHDMIRKNFLSVITDFQRAQLEAHIGLNTSYEAFAEALRSTGLAKLWGNYRRDALKLIFVERVRLVIESQNDIDKVVTQLMDSQQTLFTKKEERLPQRPGLDLQSQSSRDNTGNDLRSVRSLVQTCIEHMSFDEIRAIHLPLGAIFDALNARK